MRPRLGALIFPALKFYRDIFLEEFPAKMKFIDDQKWVVDNELQNKIHKMKIPHPNLYVGDQIW